MTDYYIRFGDWPADERSEVGTGIRLLGGGLYSGGYQYEDGVSVYPVSWDTIKQRWVIPTLGINSYMPTLDELLNGSRPVFLVTGDEVGTGTDGEPLLKNVKLIEHLDRSQLYNEELTSEDLILDGVIPWDQPPTAINTINYLFKRPGYPAQRATGCLSWERIQELVGGYFDELILDNSGIVMLICDPETPSQLRQAQPNIQLPDIGVIYGPIIITARATVEEILAGRRALPWPWFNRGLPSVSLEDQAYEIPGEEYRSLTNLERITWEEFLAEM